MKSSTKYLKILCNLMLTVAVILVIIFVVPRVIVYFMPFVVGFLFSLLVNPIVRFLDRRIKIGRKFGSVLMIALAIGIVALLAYGLVLALRTGLRDFMDYLPTMSGNAEQEVKNAIEKLQNMINDLPLISGVDLSNLTNDILEFMGGLLTRTENGDTVSMIGDVAKSIPNMIISIIVGFLATYFFIADREKLAEKLDKILPASFKEKTLRLYRQTLGAVGGYFKAQFKIMGVIYIVLVIALMILQVRYAWLIGFGIALLDMLPVFGTGTVLLPWAVIKLFSGSYQIAVGMIALYALTFLIHQLLQPKMVGDSLGMDPFAALFFMYVGYRVSSVFGMIIAIPIGMLLINLTKAGAFDTQIWCVKELVKDFNRFRNIRDTDKNEKDN
ncbi:MAG: sporulation integral membrane protein YtvI [Lachnospiraceae bacterium]|nr:sporulation integral membrane protein YtvI [Lachnospiraceae bacterium]